MSTHLTSVMGSTPARCGEQSPLAVVRGTGQSQNLAGFHDELTHVSHIIN